MKKITTLLIFLMFSFPAILLSQEEEKETSTSFNNTVIVRNESSLDVDSQEEEPETSSPSYNTEIIRNVSSLDVEGLAYNNVTVSFNSNNSSKVKVKILNVDGRVAWQKTFKNAYLYLFSTGEIHVGKPKFTKILIYKGSSGSHIGKIREHEGIY
jgi:hypothetical protein